MGAGIVYLEDPFRDDIEDVFFLLNGEVRINNRGERDRRTDETLWKSSSPES